MNITKFTKDSTDYPINDARLPASLGSASQVLKMNSGASEIVWGDQDPGVIVSPTEPSGAAENALWVDTSMSGYDSVSVDAAIGTHNSSNSAHSDIRTALDGKAASVHTHDDRYYTESEIDTTVSTLNLNKADRADVYPLINIWDEQWEIGGYSYGVKDSSTDRIRSANLIKVTPSATYYIKQPSNETDLRIYSYDANKSFIRSEGWYGNNTFTVPNDVHYINFHMASSYGTTYNSDISINYPSTYHDYYPSALPREIAERKDEDFMLAMDGFISPTINGIKNYWDGSLYHRRIARVDLGSLKWTYQSSNNRFYSSSLSSIIKKPTSTDIAFNGYCVKYSVVPMASHTDKTICVDSDGYVFIKDSAYSDANTFKSAVSGTFLYYELATEQTCNIDANGLRFDLLWTNASPTASFSAQTVSLDFSKYKFVYVVYRTSSGTGDSIGFFAVKGGSTSCNAAEGTGKTMKRNLNVTNSGAQFYGGHIYSSYGTNTNDDTYMIPYQIYGVR